MGLGEVRGWKWKENREGAAKNAVHAGPAKHREHNGMSNIYGNLVAVCDKQRQEKSQDYVQVSL